MMSFIARKVSRAKWDPRPPLGESEIGADALTTDLRTSGNALSFWACSGGEADPITDVVLALGAAADRPDKLDLVWVDRREIEATGIDLVNTEGRTPVVDLRHKHVEATRLDVSRLALLARHVATAIRATGQFKRLTKNEVIDILCHAVRMRRVALADLSVTLRREVESGLESG